MTEKEYIDTSNLAYLKGMLYLLNNVTPSEIISESDMDLIGNKIAESIIKHQSKIEET